MIAGHTKFSPDLLFAKVSQAFTTTELAQIASRYSTVVIDKGDVVRQWRTNLAKYSKFLGIREKHDLLFVKCSVSGKVLAKTCGMCFKGALENAKIHIVKGHTPEENVIPSREETYENTNQLRQISSTKLGIYNKCTQTSSHKKGIILQ